MREWTEIFKYVIKFCVINRRLINPCFPSIKLKLSWNSLFARICAWYKYNGTSIKEAFFNAIDIAVKGFTCLSINYLHYDSLHHSSSISRTSLLLSRQHYFNIVGEYSYSLRLYHSNNF